MNKFLKNWGLPLTVLLWGGVASLFQYWCLGTVDQRGLLLRGHISQILSWIVTAGVLGLLFFVTRPLAQAPKYSFNFPVSLVGGIGSILAAVGILLSAYKLLNTFSDNLTTITVYGSVLAAAALILSGFGRIQGKQWNILPHCVVCLWFLLLLICQYRQWSAEPQMQLYAFQLLATVFLMVGTYQRACFHAEMGNRQSYTFFRLAGAYFCMAALPGSEFWLFYLCAAIWSATDLCNLTPIHQEGR